MKRVFTFLCAATFGFLIAELTVRYALGFPSYGVDAKLRGIRSSDAGVQNLYLPHSRYWSVEGGNRVFTRNNAGLPGIDVTIAGGSSFVFVCGSSFVEALQVNPDSLATSTLQRCLQHDDPTQQVINLGHSGHDIYDSYFRAVYFARRFPLSRLVLVVHDFDVSALWFSRHPHPLSFALPPDFGMTSGGRATRALISVRNASALANLLVEGWRSEGSPASFVPQAVHQTVESDAGRDRDVGACLAAYGSLFPGRVLVASIITDTALDTLVLTRCTGLGIPVIHAAIPEREHFLGGGGHLTAAGNITLGKAIYESLHSFAHQRIKNEVP